MDGRGICSKKGARTSSHNNIPNPSHNNYNKQSPDGKTVACGGSDGEVHVFDLETQALLAALQGFSLMASCIEEGWFWFCIGFNVQV